MNWANYISDFTHFLRLERGLSENTIKNYEFDIKRLYSYLNNTDIVVSPLDIDSKIIQEFIYHISKSLNPRTQSRIISGLRHFFDYLIFENYRTTNP